MSQNLTIGKNNYESSSSIASSFGYTSDYVSKLAREGKVLGEKVGRSWYVDPSSLKEFIAEAEANKVNRSEQIRLERMRERKLLEQKTAIKTYPSAVDATARALGVFAAALVFVFGVYVSVANDLTVRDFSLAAVQVSSDFSEVVVGSASSQPALLGWLKDLFTVSSTNEIVVENADSTMAANKLQTNQGIVVLDENYTEEQLDEVRQQFSDPVLIERTSADSGIITPVFKEGHGDDYRFLLVPVNQATN